MVLATLVAGIVFFAVPMVIKAVIEMNKAADVGFDAQQVVFLLNAVERTMPVAQSVSVPNPSEVDVTLLNGCVITISWDKQNELLTAGSTCPAGAYSGISKITAKADYFYAKQDGNGASVDVKAGSNEYKFFFQPI